jgi:hypothetical protein
MIVRKNVMKSALMTSVMVLVLSTCVLGSGVAQAASPVAPSVDSESASSVTTNTATLSAQINPEGADTTYYFEYVDDADYNAAAPDPYSAGTQIPVPPGTDIGSAGTDQSASVDLTGLQVGVTYHFRVVAINAVGTTYGTDATFRMTETGAATDVTEFGATLNGDLNPSGVDTKYFFEFGLDTTYGVNVPVTFVDAGSGTTSIAASETVSGLFANTTYHFRLVSLSDAPYTYTYGADQTFTTLPNAPTVVAGLAAGVAPSAVTLSGTVNPLGSATTYYFEYGTCTTYGSSTNPATAGSGSVPVSVIQTIGTVAAGTTYDWRLVATNAGGTSYSADRTFTTAGAPGGSGCAGQGGGQGGGTTPQSALSITTLSGRVGTPLTLATTGGSGTGAVSYSVTNGTAMGCTVSGRSLRAKSAGTCIVTATKAADSTYLAVSSSANTVVMALPARPPAISVDLGAKGVALSSAEKSTLRALAKKLIAGASVTFTGYAEGNARLAKSRAIAAETYLLSRVKIHVTLKTVTSSAANKVTVVTTSQ